MCTQGEPPMGCWTLPSSASSGPAWWRRSRLLLEALRQCERAAGCCPGWPAGSAAGVDWQASVAGCRWGRLGGGSVCDRWPSPPLFRRDTSAGVQLHDSDRCARPAKRAGLECGQRAETATPHARRVRAGLVGLTHLLSCTPASGERLVAVPSHRALELAGDSTARLPHRPGGYRVVHACYPRVGPQSADRCLRLVCVHFRRRKW